MRSPIRALREIRRASAEEKAERQAHLERGIRWMVADHWGSIAHEPYVEFPTVQAMYMLSACLVCGEMRVCHQSTPAKKHLRLYGGRG